MDMSTIMWTTASVVLISVLGGWGHYLASIPRHRVPRVPVLMFVTQTTALLLVSASLVTATSVGQVPVGIWGLNEFALVMAIFFSCSIPNAKPR